jgi:spermidine/putrescine-binding protein
MRKLILLLPFNLLYAIPTINIFLAANYISDTTIKKFESECKCRVVQNYFNENDEMLSKIAAGASGYDIIFPTSYAVEQLIKMDKLSSLDLGTLSNLHNINPEFLHPLYDSENHYSVPYAYDNVMLAYNKPELDKLGINPNSWAVIFEPRYLKQLHGRVTVLNSARNVFAAALLYLGRDPNSSNIDDIYAAAGVIKNAMPYWAKFDSDTYYRSLIRGDIVLSMSYSVDIYRTLEDLKLAHKAPYIEASLQKEGNMYELDNLVIPKTSKMGTLNYQFINYILKADSAIELSKHTGASIFNLPALSMIGKLDIDWVYPPDMHKMYSFRSYLPKTRILINELWLEMEFSCNCH